MGKLVQPKVFLVGYTQIDLAGVRGYLQYTDQTEFNEDLDEAEMAGISGAECLCSMFAKMCYKSLVVGKNSNIKKTRSIRDNLEATHNAAHGSVFEHVGFNFVVTDCSRVFTHELVRHRVGTAFSQTSGRYCRLDTIDLVWDPILDPVKELFDDCTKTIEKTVYMAECKLGLRMPNPERPKAAYDTCLGWSVISPEKELLRWIPDPSFDFEKRKKITSAVRRIAPNGQSNEIAFTVNIRALRHLIQLRTARFAEWEIRNVFAQIYHLISARHPLIFYGAKTRIVDDLPEVYGMRLQPYELEIKE